MKTREPLNLTKLGAIYGALWGFVVGPLGTTSLVGDGRFYAAKIALSMAGWGLLGAPVGIAVTRHFGPRLRHASWRRVLGLAPLTLVAGSFLFGCLQVMLGSAVCYLKGGTGQELADAMLLPLIYVAFAFLMVWPIALAVLNCWDLRTRLSRATPDKGVVWKIRGATGA